MLISTLVPTSATSSSKFAL